MKKSLLLTSVVFGLAMSGCATVDRDDKTRAASPAENQYRGQTRVSETESRKESESRQATLGDATEDAAKATREAVNDIDEKRGDIAESETKYNTGKTAEDQSNKPADVEITRQIRRDLMNQDDLSMSAKNIKIITEDGKVTLKGKVENKTERKLIRDAALARAGGKANVKDQLVVGEGEDVNDMKEE